MSLFSSTTTLFRMDPRDLRESVHSESTLCKSHFHSKKCIFEIFDTDGDCSSTSGFPDVPIDSESSKENQSEIPSLSIYQDVGTDLSRNVRKQMDGWV